MPHDSDSAVQREAERLAREKVGETIGKKLTPATVRLDSGASVQVDGVAGDESVFAEVFAHQGALKGGQKHKVAQDALKLITIGRSRPDAELLMVFVDEDAAAYATTGTWVAEALAAWRVKVVVVELEQTVRDGIRAAQVRQKMINPSPSAETEP